MSISSIEQTAPQNVKAFISTINSASLAELLINANYTLNIVYPWIDWQLAAVYENVTMEEFQSSCLNCFSVWEGEYQLEAAWLAKNSTSSIPAEAESQLQQVVTID